ncbi:hypothetical protein [Leptolyngbya ohadii]|uniref:hypothetical protein n=1 Tax=Leptolyngbya ohadii TaxID=1962290 RepID=UPI000B5A21B3|nr:hypothetical protein [Leptolyngbya ohadii]
MSFFQAIFSVRFFLIGLSLIVLSSCRPEDSTVSLEAQTTPIAPPTDNGGSASPAPVIPNQEGTTAAIPQGSSCVTENYFADVVSEGGQLLMTFVRKPSIASLNQAPATRTVNADGSVTFAAGRENTFYVRVFPNQACFLQTVGGDGRIGMEETGRTRNSIQSVVQPTPTPVIVIPGQIKPPVVDPPGPVTRPPVVDPPGPTVRPPVVDPPGPVTRPPVVDPSGPTVRPPITDPAQPITRPAVTEPPRPTPKPAIPNPPNSTAPTQNRPAVSNPPSPTPNPLAR